MNLLITNDDGIDSAFLGELVAALLAAGHNLFVVAPKCEQSWIGAAKTRNRPLKSTAVDCGFGCPAWTVDGTPGDCVNIALAHLLPAPVDAVVSGINVGSNTTLGFILASGTLAGAWEGVLHGLPAIALSQELSEALHSQLKATGCRPNPALLATVRNTAGQAAGLLPGLVEQTPAGGFVVHNLNFPFPCLPDTPVRRTVPARVHVPGLFSAPSPDGRHHMRWGEICDFSPPQPLTDRACLQNGHISHSVLDYGQLGLI